MITPDLLDRADAESIEGWAEDVHEQFGFFVAVQPLESSFPSEHGEQLQRTLQKLEPLGEKLVGVMAVAAAGREEPSQLDGLRHECDQLGVMFSQVDDMLADYSLGEGVISLQGGDGVALLQATDELAPMVVRKVVEVLRERDIGTLFFTPGLGVVANLKTVETISSLLGVSSQ